MKMAGMLVVSLRGVNFGFWSHLGCSGQNAVIFRYLVVKVSRLGLHAMTINDELKIYDDAFTNYSWVKFPISIPASFIWEPQPPPPPPPSPPSREYFDSLVQGFLLPPGHFENGEGSGDELLYCWCQQLNSCYSLTCNAFFQVLVIPIVTERQKNCWVKSLKNL